MIRSALRRLGGFFRRPEPAAEEGLSLTPPPPRTIYVIINRACNLRCRMCDVGQQQRDRQFYRVMSPSEGAELTLADLRKLIADVRGFKPAIAVTSTEPLLFAGLFDFAAEVRAAEMDFQLTTNGLLLPDCAEEAVESGVTSLWVSLDGPAEAHNAIRGHPESFQRAVEGLRKVREASVRTGRAVQLCVNYTYSNHNVGALTGLLESLADVGVDAVVASHMNYVTEAMAAGHNAAHGSFCEATAGSVGQADPAAADVAAMWTDIQAARGRSWPFSLSFGPDLDEQGLTDFYRRPEVIVGPPRCRAPWTMAQLAANGDWVVSTRCFVKIMGNLRQESFLTTWHGPRYREFRAWLRDTAISPACRRCCGAL